MKFSIICAAGAALFATPALAQPQPARGEMVLYQGSDYQGEQLVLDVAQRRVRADWAVRSLAVHPGDRWLICARSRFRGACVVLDRSLQDISLIGDAARVGSARQVSERPPVPAAVPDLIPSQPPRLPGT